METISQFLDSGGAPIFLAFLIGLAFGALMRAIAADPGDEQGPNAPVSADHTQSGEVERKINAVRTDLQETKALLTALQSDDESLDAELDALDNAVKRANGRLKLILKSIGKDQK